MSLTDKRHDMANHMSAISLMLSMRRVGVELGRLEFMSYGLVIAYASGCCL